jgi:sensor histidine kinase YesM
MAGVIKKIVFRKEYSLVRHILFWLLYLFVFTLMLYDETSGFWDTFRTAFLFFPINILYAYVTLYWFVPKYLITGKYLNFFFAYCIWATADLILIFFYRYYVLFPMWTGKAALPFNLSRSYREIFQVWGFIGSNTVAMFAVFIRMFKYWHSEQLQKLQIQQEKTKAELQLLKAQLHPHFLFNTLNNLYALVLEKSDKAPDMLMRLSALLNYVLYECRASEVLLEKEICVCKDYVALEQERYGDRLEISMNFSGDIEGKMVAPMLFQPFIENAFKHGTSEQVGRVWMSIELSVKNEQLFFRVINSADWTLAAPMTGGIGINNVRRRLELLYPGNYSLTHEAGQDVYIVSLTIELGLSIPVRKWLTQDAEEHILYEDPVFNYR